MINFGFGINGNNQITLWHGLFLATAVHVILAFCFMSFLNVHQYEEREQPQKNITVELEKKSEKIVHKTPNKLTPQKNVDSLDLESEILVSNKPRSQPNVTIHPSKSWVTSEVQIHNQQSPDSIEKFKQSFKIKNTNDIEPSVYIIESSNASVSVKKNLFGREICYSFDANDNSSGVIIFNQCKEQPNFSFKMKSGG